MLNSKIARKIHLGQSIRVIGFPSQPGHTPVPLSYEKGYIVSMNFDGSITDQTRYGTALYWKFWWSCFQYLW